MIYRDRLEREILFERGSSGMMPAFGSQNLAGLDVFPYLNPRNCNHCLGKTRGNPYIECMLQSDLFPGASSRLLNDESAIPAGGTIQQNPTLCEVLMVPIRTLAESDRAHILSHLLALKNTDRYLRFGHAATDEHIAAYVHGLDFTRDEIFGIFNRKLQLLALAHLAYPGVGVGRVAVEFGVSVTSHARGRGYGTRLFERAAIHARNDGFGQMYIHALSENGAMLAIARKAGAVVHRDGSESDAFLRLPPANLDSRVSEIVQEQLAQADYRMKRQARQFSRLLGSMRLDSGSGDANTQREV